MARKETLLVRLTVDEKQRLVAYANSKGVSMSEIIQDYCKRLPKPPEKDDSREARVDSFGADSSRS